ncbi:Beta-lactamase class C [Enhygromyxa salina]|uniref:Beta-lactamase class C n=1 Tax=Enhygromyxa salina TaxID=215803 RepID=A0A0C2CQ34_9BACT|nr:Beta-lactamase class C [Enhygromyxa salina]
MEAPQLHGLSNSGVAQLATVAEQTNSSCVVVIHDGVLVSEWYASGYDASTPVPDIMSATKSVINAIVGVAEGQGLLDIADPASDYIQAWQATESAGVTILELMSQTSGREWDFFTDLFIVSGVEDETAYALSFGQDHEPGDHWEYSNHGTQSLEAVLEVAVGQDVEEFAQTELFEKIGMDVSMARDNAGNPQMYRGLSASCRDMAKFGYLYLRNGHWRGQQLVPNAFVQESLEASSSLNDAYGYLWWRNYDGHSVMPSTPARTEFEGKMLPSGSEDGFMAFGAYGQLVFVDPEDEYVVVRLSDVYDPNNPFGLDQMDAVLAAFEAAKVEQGCDGP